MSEGSILVAHADARAARELAARLSAIGLQAGAIVHSAEACLAALPDASPALVLMDAALAAAPGARRALDALRLLRPAPIVFLTTDDGVDAVRAAGPTAGDGVLVAPFTDRELRLAVEVARARFAAAGEARGLEDRFFAISIDMLCFLDFGGYFKRLNPAWERTLGWTIEELMSRPFIEFVHPDDRERTLAQNASVRAGGRALGFENRYLCKDGSFRWFLWNAAPDAAERVIYSVARDITAKKEADAERERLVGELRTALAEVKVLREILPICSYCRKIRDDENYWMSVESYISRHTNTQFSHGICPSCLATAEREMG